MSGPRGRRGFTLLEVMVSISILALALTAIAGINANSFESSNYARHVTVATLLARSKMLDVELLLQKDGFGDSDKEYDGDFSEEGYPKLRWAATVRKVEVDIGQLLGGLLGGEVSAESLPDQVQGFLGAMQGNAPSADVAGQVESSELKKLLGGGQIEDLFKQVTQTLGDSIREITLEITWGRPGIDEENVRFVQYVTSTGRLSVPAGVAAAPGLGGLGGLGGLPGLIPGAAEALTPGGRIPQSAIPPTVGGLPNPAAGPGSSSEGGKP